MKNYKYLIIGAGMTAAAAAHGIREIDQQGSIGMIGWKSTLLKPPASHQGLVERQAAGQHLAQNGRAQVQLHWGVKSSLD